MKLISFKAQKIIMFVPYVNIINMYIYLYNCKQMNIHRLGFPKALLIVFANALPLLILGTIVDSAFALPAHILTVLSNVNAYLVPLLIGRGLIKYQQQLLDEVSRSE